MILLNLLFLQFGCAGMAPTYAENPSGDFVGVMSQLAYEICTKLSYPSDAYDSNPEYCQVIWDEETCGDIILNAQNVGTAVGLNNQPDMTFQEVYSAEKSGEIIPKNEFLVPCLDDIQELNCSDGIIQSILEYDLQEQIPVAELLNEFPGTCGHLFNDSLSLFSVSPINN